jgi:hypothetical protein
MTMALTEDRSMTEEMFESKGGVKIFFRAWLPAIRGSRAQPQARHPSFATFVAAQGSPPAAPTR